MAIGIGCGGDYTDIFVLRLYWEKRRSAWSGPRVSEAEGAMDVEMPTRVAIEGEGHFENTTHSYHIGGLGPLRVLKSEVCGDAIGIFDVVGRRRATRNDGAVWVCASVCECLLDGRLSKPIKKTSKASFPYRAAPPVGDPQTWWTIMGQSLRHVIG